MRRVLHRQSQFPNLVKKTVQKDHGTGERRPRVDHRTPRGFSFRRKLKKNIFFSKIKHKGVKIKEQAIGSMRRCRLEFLRILNNFDFSTINSQFFRYKYNSLIPPWETLNQTLKQRGGAVPTVSQHQPTLKSSPSVDKFITLKCRKIGKFHHLYFDQNCQSLQL